MVPSSGKHTADREDSWPASPVRSPRPRHQTALLTVEKAVLIFPPRAATTPTMTAAMRATNRPYSTAVAPRSLAVRAWNMDVWNFAIRASIGGPLSGLILHTDAGIDPANENSGPYGIRRGSTNPADTHRRSGQSPSSERLIPPRTALIPGSDGRAVRILTACSTPAHRLKVFRW
jgi:hypothetical protein